MRLHRFVSTKLHLLCYAASILSALCYAASILSGHGEEDTVLSRGEFRVLSSEGGPVALSSAAKGESGAAHHMNIRGTRRALDTATFDFIITCESDTIILELGNVSSSIVRKCTVNSFGSFTNRVALTCEQLSMPGVECEISASSLAIAHNPSATDVTVTIHADTQGQQVEGEILVSAVYGSETRSDSIPVIIGGERAVAKAAARDLDTGSSKDLFLLSGQSNMHGHTTSGQSIGGSDTYWLAIKGILESGVDAVTMENNLQVKIHAEQIARNGDSPVSVSITLANETMKLYNAGLLSNLDTSLTYGSCSFVEPQNAGGVIDKSGGTKASLWNANCGGAFSHELMFQRTLELEMGQSSSFEAVKNAKGGTEIHKHWYPGYGIHYNELQQTIAERAGTGNWKAFIWHQGTQEAWPAEDTSMTYLGNLTDLISEVRAEMFAASETGFWQCKEEIPVVVVQIGFWPQSTRAQNVRDAQQQYCNGDPKAELATVYDLSRFYHFDAPSFLVGGNRIAHAYKLAAEASYTCPINYSLLYS